MPRNPKPGAPLSPRERELAKVLPESTSVAEAGRKVGMTKQAAHDAYKALKIKAPERCEQLGISRDRVLLRFDQIAEGATKLIRVNLFEVREVPDNASRLRANENLMDIFGDGRSGGDADPGGHSFNRNTVCLVVSDEKAAERLARLFAPRSSAGNVMVVGKPVDESTGY